MTLTKNPHTQNTLAWRQRDRREGGAWRPSFEDVREQALLRVVIDDPRYSAMSEAAWMRGVTEWTAGRMVACQIPTVVQSGGE